MIDQVEMEKRLAAIDSVDKAMASLKECAYLSGVFNRELSETLNRVATVLADAATREAGVVRIGDPGPSKLGDMRFHGDVLLVDLWYPNIKPDPRAPPRTPDHPIAIEVGLMHVRAADSIRVEYDFDRDGYSIQQASKFHWDVDDKVQDQDWQEVAFVQAWAREVEEPER